MRDFDHFESPAKEDEKETLLNFAKKYEGMSEQQLVNEILELAMENKRAGKLTNEEIDRYVELLSPMLSEDKRKKLLQLSQKLKT